MSAKKSDEAIPLKVLEMAIVMVNAADQCDQAGQWDRDHRRACRHILDWYNSNDYKITCDKAGVKDAPPKSNADRIRQMTDEELAEFLDKDASYTCLICARRDAKDSCGDYECKNVVLKWLKQEANEDATD